MCQVSQLIYTGRPRFAVTSEPGTAEQWHHWLYCGFTAAAEMTKRINHTARKLRLINYPWINKSLQAETGAVSWVSPKDPLRSLSLLPLSTQSPECVEKRRTEQCQSLQPTATRWEQAVSPVGALRASGQLSCISIRASAEVSMRSHLSHSSLELITSHTHMHKCRSVNVPISI